MIKSCAFRGRSKGEWYASEHRQMLEIGSEMISNCVSGVAKDFLLLEISNVGDKLIMRNPQKNYGMWLIGEICPALLATDYKSPPIVFEIEP